MIWSPLCSVLLSNRCSRRADGIKKRLKGLVIVDLCELAWLIVSCAMASPLLRVQHEFGMHTASHGWAQDLLVPITLSFCATCMVLIVFCQHSFDSLGIQNCQVSINILLITHLSVVFCRLSVLTPWVGFSRGSLRRWMRTHATPHPPPSPLPAQAGTRRGRAAIRTPWIPIPATPAPQQQILTVSILF